MKKLFSKFVLIYGCVLTMSASAATLFTDDFQDSVSSIGKWVFPSAASKTFKNSALNVTNTDTHYLMLVTHNFTSKIRNFTLSATISLTSSTSNTVGLMCCISDSGYIMIELGNAQNIYASLLKPNGEDIELLNTINSFITTGANVLTISKRDSVFNIFCNDVFVGSFNVSLPSVIGGGDISLLLPPRVQATYDNILMTDDFKSGVPITCYSDNFSDPQRVGWNDYAVKGSAQVSNGLLTMNNTDTEFTSLRFVNGNFKTASLKVITKHKSGDGVYGCAFVYTVKTAQGTSYKIYSFLISSAQQYAVGSPTSTNILVSQQKSFIHGSSGSATDTLEINRFNNFYQFKINGTLTEDALAIPANLVPDAAGLYLGPKTSVSYSMFAVGGDSLGTSCSITRVADKPFTKFIPLNPFISNDAVAFNALGRIVKRFDGNCNRALQNSAAGMYFLKSNSTGHAVPVKVMAR
jgi:hypothetical protein